MKIRNATTDDFARILQLNTIEVAKTSAMDFAKLQQLDAMASYHKVILINDTVEGFLLAFESGTNYQSDNYTWFNRHFQQYLYIDRIVVNLECPNKGLGSALYRDFIDFANDFNCAIVCEYNLDPLNTRSEAFHAKFNFKEIGRHMTNSGKLVSMQARDPNLL